MPTKNRLLPFALFLLPLSCGVNDDNTVTNFKPAPAAPAAAAPDAAAPAGDAASQDRALAAIDAFIAEQGPKAKTGNWRLALEKPPKVEFDPAHAYVWHMQTNKGEIGITLLPATAPMHVSSTIYLARLGFYDGLPFHRVINGFMAQGGCPLGTGSGNPGYQYAGEFDPDVQHDKAGKLSMANAGPGTDGSQFFLTFRDTQYLNGKHTIFGEVSSGMDVVRALEACGSQSGRTTEPLKMERTWIEVKPTAASK